MSQQNIQNCSICLKEITKIRNISDDLKFKINNCPDKDYYSHLTYENNKLCSDCYMKIVNSYQRQISTINRNSKNLMETSRPTIPANLTESTIDLMEINNLIDISNTNISTNLIEMEE
ncbi:812_t:CDS:1, partial [Dentiscutata erythropus]